MEEIKKEKILITVKTYPTLSTKYGETVCTAGLREDGTWVRIYPVPFRRLDEKQRYKKFNWIECILQRNSKKDFRPESYRPVDPDNECQFEPTGFVDTKNNWRQRRNLVLRKAVVYTSMEELIKDAKNENKLTSLAVFKPKQLLGFETEKTDSEWSEEQLRKMREYNRGQLDLFSDEEWRKVFRIVKKVPFKFFYRFKDSQSRVRRLEIIDWEIGALYWNLMKSNDTETTLKKIKQKYFLEFSETDIHFFLGTTYRFHRIAPNPFMIIGVFPIPYETQRSMF